MRLVKCHCRIHFKCQGFSVYTKIGMDIRWILGAGIGAGRNNSSESCLTQLLLEVHEEYRVPVNEELLSQAATFVGLCRQIVIRQYLGEGIIQCYLPDGDELDQSSRAAIGKTIERVTSLSSHQSNRLLNGLGLFGDKEKVLSTGVMMERRIAAHDGSMKDMDIIYPVLLALGSSDRVDRFMLSPYAFAANTASSLLRTRVQADGSDQQKIADAQAEQRKLYPPTDEIKQDLGRRRIMALYGLYIWASGAQHFIHGNHVDDRANRLATLTIAIRMGWNKSSWVFAEDRSVLGDNCPNTIPSDFLEKKLEAIEEVATRVGMAVCGKAPYNRIMGS